MTEGVLNAIGGLGLFLLGMSLLTSGLKALSDERLRKLLARSTNNVVSGVATGAATTALVQSSSATTVMAVGFVGAGLLTFPQALGIVFGANIGTTITGWLVALLGFKLKLGEVSLPLILVGVLLKMFARGKTKSTGDALGGFGLIFVGISLLQSGMAGFEGTITPDLFPPDTFGGRLLLVLIGLGITIITQSSSAGVATALAAVNTGTISLPQAAAMVIGMDLGTTFTAALATIGGNVSARRTGFAHVVYNVLTAAMAFALLSLYLRGVSAISPNASADDPELVLVGFHTFFNGIGVLAILPFTRQFADLIERLFPEKGNPLTVRLDRSLLKHPASAMSSMFGTISDVTAALFRELARRLSPSFDGEFNDDIIQQAEEAVDQLHSYLESVSFHTDDADLISRYVAALHTLDHLDRVIMRARQESRIRRVRQDASLSDLADQAVQLCESMASTGGMPDLEQLASIRSTNQSIKSGMRLYRRQVVSQTAKKEILSAAAIERMDTARWLRRIGSHCWRIAFHLSETRSPKDLRESKLSVSANDQTSAGAASPDGDSL